MTLTKKISRIGNSYGVILPNEFMKVAGLEPGGECEIETQGESIILRAHFKENKKDQTVAKATSRFIRKYRQDLQKLA